MYSFKRRIIISSIAPLLFLAIYIISWSLSASQARLQEETTLSQIIFQTVLTLTSLSIAYVISVLFFSIESVTKILLSKPNLNKIIKRIKKRSVVQNIEVLEKYDTLEQYKLTKSVVFQGLVITTCLYASFSTGSVVGKVLAFSIALQLLYEQGSQIFIDQDIQDWFWQVSDRINIDIQRMYFLGASIMTFIAFYFLL